MHRSKLKWTFLQNGVLLYKLSVNFPDFGVEIWKESTDQHCLAENCTIENGLRACMPWRKNAKRSKRDQLATQPEMCQKNITVRVMPSLNLGKIIEEKNMEGLSLPVRAMCYRRSRARDLPELFRPGRRARSGATLRCRRPHSTGPRAS